MHKSRKESEAHTAIFSFLEIKLKLVGILKKRRETEVGKLVWHGNFDTGMEMNIDFFE